MSRILFTTGQRFLISSHPPPAALCCREHIWSTLDKFNCAMTCTCTDTLQQLGHKLCLLQEPSRTAQWEMSGSCGAASCQHTLSIPWMQQRRHRGTKPLLPARQAALIPSPPAFCVVGTYNFNISRFFLCQCTNSVLKSHTVLCAWCQHQPGSSDTPLGAGGGQRAHIPCSARASTSLLPRAAPGQGMSRVSPCHLLLEFWKLRILDFSTQ